MKIKQYIGQIINGFLILDSYKKDLPSGSTTRKVLIKCVECGRVFERNSGVNFEHIKCECKVKYKNKKLKRLHEKTIEYNGEIYNQTELCKKYNIPDRTMSDWLKKGISIDEAIKREFILKCVICDKEFKSDRPGKKYCCKTCQNRGIHGKGKRKEPIITECVVCGKTFETIRDDAKTCSIACRRKRDRYTRGRRYRDLAQKGHSDPSVTLEAVFEKFNGQCCICNNKLSFDFEITSNCYPSIDHIIPLSRGGFHEWNNVQLLCRGCNIKKGAKLIAV